jgi:hypothetical protein
VTERHSALTLWETGLVWGPAPDIRYADVHVADVAAATYRARVWESPVVESDWAATELIPSWNARTPPGTWLLVEGRVADVAGWTPWFTVARWAEDDPVGEAPITRTTVRDQVFDAGHVAIDRWLAAPGRGFDRWQLRLTALVPVAGHRPDPAREGEWPAVSLVGAAASRFAIGPGEATSAPTADVGHEVGVPTRSQRLHVGTFPEWDSGGQSWCSPTSTTMLLEHWGRGPGPGEYAWVGDGVDPQVVHGVRRVFDRAYGGAGNWAFNTAYAGTRGLRAYVTRLRVLTEA